PLEVEVALDGGVAVDDQDARATGAAARLDVEAAAGEVRDLGRRRRADGRVAGDILRVVVRGPRQRQKVVDHLVHQGGAGRGGRGPHTGYDGRATRVAVAPHVVLLYGGEAVQGLLRVGIVAGRDARDRCPGPGAARVVVIVPVHQEVVPVEGGIGVGVGGEVDRARRGGGDVRAHDIGHHGVLDAFDAAPR